MDMGMRHIDADNSLTHLDAGANLLQATSNATAEEMQLGKQLVIKVKDVINLFLRDAKDVPADNRVDVEKGQTMLGLGHTIAGDFACNDFAENTCHDEYCLSFDFNQFEGHLACRDIDLNNLAHLVAKESRSER